MLLQKRNRDKVKELVNSISVDINKLKQLVDTPESLKNIRHALQSITRVFEIEFYENEELEHRKRMVAKSLARR